MTKLITEKPLTTALTGRTLSECHCFLNILTFFHNGLFCFLARLYPRKRLWGAIHGISYVGVCHPKGCVFLKLVFQ